MNSNRSRETIEVAPSSSSFSVSEKLALYGSTGLSGMELLVLLVGKESVANALVRHFGSLRALSCASFLELRQFPHGVKLRRSWQPFGSRTLLKLSTLYRLR